MRLRVDLTLFVLIALHGRTSQAIAQAPTATMPATVELGQGCVLDLPQNWARTPDVAVGQAFFERSDASTVMAFHPMGSRPTDLPYALIEMQGWPRGMTLNRDLQSQMAEQTRTYYLTAIRPPSKADRYGSWKRADVTPVVYDFAKRRFSFTAKVQFDTADYHVNVSGIFGVDALVILNTWADDTAKEKRAAELAALASSFRLNTTITPPPATPREKLLNFARVAGVLFILLVVGVQAFVLIKDRRQRQAEAAAMRRLLD